MSNDKREQNWDVCPELQDPSYRAALVAKLAAQDKAFAEGCDFATGFNDKNHFFQLTALLRQFQINFGSYIPHIHNFPCSIFLSRKDFVDKLQEAISHVTEIRLETRSGIDQASDLLTKEAQTNETFDLVSFSRLISLLVDDVITRSLVSDLFSRLRSRQADLTPIQRDILNILKESLNY